MSKSMVDESNIPVIAAVGEVCHRPSDPAAGREPVVLMADALRLANAELNNQLLSRLDSLALVGQVSWRYSDPVKRLCDKLGIQPKSAKNASMGGDTPTRLVHEAALRISRGEDQVCAIVGGEAISAKRKARAASVTLDWTPRCSPDKTVVVDEQDFPLHADVRRCNLASPAQCYPLYEMAYQASRGQTPEQGITEAASLWHEYAEVAESNPCAWIKQAPDIDTIKTPSDNNRLIAYPYPKLMVANSVVNQAAAIVVCSLQWAKSIGLTAKQIAYIWGGAIAREPDDFLARDQFVQSHAQNAVLDAAVRLVGGDSKLFDVAELYSCFPIVPKLALQRLTLKEAVKPTVTGGLTFFGGPMNNFMAHGVCGVFRKLTNGEAELGLLYANGGFLTKHHALVIASRPPVKPLSDDFSVQDAVKTRYGDVPEYCSDYQGPAKIETFTVFYGRSGLEQGFVVLTTPDAKRTVAIVSPDDDISISLLTNAFETPIGKHGEVFINHSGTPVWTFTKLLSD